MQLFATLLPNLTQFAAPAKCAKSFLGLEPWDVYFPNNWFGAPSGVSVPGGDCNINSNFVMLPSSGQSGLLLIGLAILDDLLRIATLVAVGYVIYGGIQYMISNGSPDATKKAQKTIINSLAGLVIAILAAAIVSFIGGQLGS